MPRGPGKPENYNLNYSRFDKFDLEGLDGLDDDDGGASKKAPEKKPSEPAGPPEEMKAMMRNLPGELQEAYRLMSVHKETGDEKAQKRAIELAMKAIEKGGPEVKSQFSQHMAKEMAKHPEAKQELEDAMNEATGGSLGSKAAKKADPMLLEGSIKTLRQQMEDGQKNAQAQLDALKKQQDALQNLQGPEDFFKFMNEQGLSQEDLQRAFAGDEKHMEQMVQKCLAKTDGDKEKGESERLTASLEAVDQLHGALTGDGGYPEKKSTKPKPAPKKKIKEPDMPSAKIPEHRVQYVKNDKGQVDEVSLWCELPGVESMDKIDLDVSERYLRLRTTSPAYVVNAGPFPVLVNASAARAKFSKKKQELKVTVPAKP